MSCPNEITIGDDVYVRQTHKSDVKIVVLQRGWVVVGRFSREGDDCSLTNASVIRAWGTSKGLGEIAMGGPTAQTRLDPLGRTSFHILTAVHIVDAKEDKWTSALR